MGKKKKKEKTKGIIDYSFILTFIIVFVSNDTLLFGTNGNRLFFWGHIGILFIAFLYMLTQIRSLSGGVVVFVCGMALLMLATMLVNADDDIVKYFYNIFIMLMIFSIFNIFLKF